MAHKHLHELLREDQEPFQLKNYIADRRCQLKTPKPPTLQLNKPKSIIHTSTSRRSLCKQACFFSFHDSPDVRKSPFLDLPSPAKSPCKSPNAVFLQIPARTAAMLLEAAMRIQKQSSAGKPKTQTKNVRFGLFGSILRRLTDKNRPKKREIGAADVRVSENYSFEKSARKCQKLEENPMGVDEKSAYEMGFSCSCSASWSESNEEKDLETSSCCRSDYSEERENGDFPFIEDRFCPSPFRFSLQKSPSTTGRRTPDFLSPATSPIRHIKEEEESLQKNQLEEDEEKEQCSPVSVLDPPFEDEDEREGGDEEEDDYDLECSYTIVQKAKQQLLHKLRRFERLAELDPIELEKRMLEEQDDENLLEEGEYGDDESLSLCSEENVDEFVREVFGKSSFCHRRKIPADMKLLISDLIAEEKRNGMDDSEGVVKRVCKKLDSWKEVESNTIDMMVELDFRRETDGWKRNDHEQMGKTAMDIEIGIFGILVEELSEELVSLAGL